MEGRKKNRCDLDGHGGGVTQGGQAGGEGGVSGRNAKESHTREDRSSACFPPIRSFNIDSPQKERPRDTSGSLMRELNFRKVLM